MDEGLVPVDIYGYCDGSGHITSTLKFPKDVKTFDMFTDIRFPDFTSEYDPVLDLVRNFGWTVEKLILPYWFNDEHAGILLDVVRDRGSRITRLTIDPYTLTTTGMNVLDEIVEMSPSVVSIGMWYFGLEVKAYRGKVESLLTQYKAQLHHVVLHGDKMGDWSSQIAGVIPTRDALPKMDELTFDIGNGEVSKECIAWIVAMISTPPQPRSKTTLPEPLTGLKRITLGRIVLSYEDWESVIRAIDLTEVEWLDLQTTNFGQAQLRLLVNQITDNVASQIRVRTLCINEKLLEQEEARTLCTTLREKAPLVNFN
ncbi:MAG: hypothetical protein J3Q66DRAFT_368965 [Benniella sp.]|nr:MAG: hypothetical protein J3Q66DRAFT_368965 [Benniella sp.]